MHPPEVKAAAVEPIEQGINDCESSRRLGIPGGTIRDWRRPTYVPRESSIPRETCPRCWRTAKPMRFTPEDYTELLGLYLGDGSISRHPRAHRLRLALDAKYPGIIEDAGQLLERCFPHNAVDVVTKGLKGNLLNISVYSRHLTCLVPQHGCGKKHERKLKLEPWQTRLVEGAPWGFLRGCIRSDGCAFINRTDIHRPRPYEYLSYDFSNKSEDIVPCSSMAADWWAFVTGRTSTRAASCGTSESTDAAALPSCLSMSDSRPDALDLNRLRGCAGTGRQACLRRMCPQGRVGSNPTSRIPDPPNSAGRPIESPRFTPLSSRGLGRRILSPETRVRIPVAVPH